MNRIRKRILAAALAAVVVITMPGTASYALEENVQTEYISDISTELEEANAAEEPETENTDIENPGTEDSSTEKPKAETGDTEEKETDIEEITEEEPDSVSEENTADTEQRDTGAEDDSTNLCAHHKEHTKECGYSRASEDGEGRPCTYECRICPIEDLIAALPDAVTEDNAEDVQEQLNKILDLYRELTAEEQEQIDISRCLELQAALDETNVPTVIDEPTEGAVAKVEKEGEAPIYVTSLADAFADGNSGATVTLLADLMMSNCINILYNRTFTLDLNGHTISCSYTAFRLNAGGNLTIRDSGENGGIATYADSHAVAVLGALTLEGGRFSSSGDGYNGVNVYNDTVLNVTGEDVYINKLFVDKSQEITLSAGTYGSITSRNSLDNLLGENCAYYGADGKPLVLDGLGGAENLKTLTGPVTVQKCEHEGVKPTSNDDGTHSVECPYCGYTNEAEDCGYGEEYEYDDTKHTQTCTLCGGKKTEAHTVTRLAAEVSDTVITVSEACACGYAEELGTVTLTIPEDLIYGETLDKQITWETDLELVHGMLALRLDSGAERFYSQSCFLSDLIGKVKQLSAGEHTLEVTVDMTEDIKNPKYAQCSIHFTIFKATLTPSIDTDGSTPTKTYDGTTTVSSDGMGIKLEGIVGDDDVTATATSYEYDSADAGARTIIAGGITLSGDDAGNYELSDDTARIDGTIDKATGTLTVPETLFSKKYGEADFSLQCSTNGDGEISYVSDNENVVTVSADGMVQIKGMGEATVTVSLAEGRNYTSAAARTVTITVDKGDIPEGLWISGLPQSVPYTGSAVKPEGISVYHGDTLLREKTEYTISYKNNTNAGTAQLIVTGKGNYKGKCTAEFTIEPVDLSADSGIAATIATVTETGKNLKPTVTVTWSGKKLKEKKDYTLSYETGIKTASEEGYAVTISGKGNYTGSIERRFYVRPRGTKLLNSAKVTGIKKSYEYQSSEMNDENGDAQGQDTNPSKQDASPEEQNALPKGLEADLVNITVKIGTTMLIQGTDYRVRVENGNAVGTGYVVIEPAQTSDYAGEKRISFNITGTNIKKCFITGLEKSYPYTGQPIRPEIEVYTGKNGTGTQIPSAAYTVSYSNYTNQGKATVTVTGIPEKGCSGSVKATYSIGRLDLATGKETGSITVTIPGDIKYAKGGAKPQPVIIHSDNGVIRILREGVDYTLKYSNNTAKYSTSSGATSTGSTKKPTLKITGIGNYTGNITENYDINVQDIGDLAIAVTDKIYNSKKKGSYYYSVPKVYDFDGKQLKSGKDYTVQYTSEATGQEIGKTDTVENGTQIRVTVTAAENSNYEGTLSRTYYVREAKDVKDISKVKYDKIAAQQYTGSGIEPEVKLYTLTGKTKNYLTEEDYGIIGYYNNIKRGTATVLIRGTGAYSGAKSITFKITSADNKLIWFGIF